MGFLVDLDGIPGLLTGNSFKPLIRKDGETIPAESSFTLTAEQLRGARHMNTSLFRIHPSWLDEDTRRIASLLDEGLE